MHLRFRPHHFLCALGFRGKGYSDAFVRQMQAIVDRLRCPGGDEVEFEVVGITDSICAPCPNRRGEQCETEERIRKLDEAHAALLGVAPGEVITWGEAKERLATRVSIEAHHRACDGCSWRELRLCEAALVELKAAREVR